MKTLIAACLLLAACTSNVRPKGDVMVIDEKYEEPAAEGDQERGITGSRIERPAIDASREGLTFAGQPALMAVIADPPRDEKYPARNRQLLIPSGPVRPELGRPAEMNALFFLASGDGRKPTMLLLHGLPGNERNLDLAQAVRRAGWNVLTFTYRGAWGSEGTFSIQHAVEDAARALDFLRSDRAVREFNVDRSRIVIAGHSMGGFAAAATAASDTVDTRADAPPPEPAPRPIAGSPPPPPLYHVLTEKRFHPLAGLVLLDAWDIGASAAQLKAAGAAGRAGFIAAFDDIGRSLGPITAADIADELIRRGSGWSLAPLAPALSRLPVLNIAASIDGNAAEMHAFTGAIGRFGQANVHHVELRTDHSFADTRVALATEVVKWLQDLPLPRTSSAD
jgi:pimeloyl-ACP methyl ester carboxylesterase